MRFSLVLWSVCSVWCDRSPLPIKPLTIGAVTGLLLVPLSKKNRTFIISLIRHGKKWITISSFMERVIMVSNEEHKFNLFGLAVHVGEIEFPLLTGTVGLPRTNSIHHYWTTRSSITRSMFIKERSTVVRRLDDKMMTHLIESRYPIAIIFTTATIIFITPHDTTASTSTHGYLIRSNNIWHNCYV